MQKVFAGSNTVFSGRISGVTEDVFLTAVPLRKEGKISGAVIIYSPLSLVLNKLINITAERMKQIASAKEIEIKTTIPPEGITVLGNIDRLKQVLTNLMDNAISHSQPGGMVTVELGVQDDFAFMAVKDTGPGIPPEELANIWERFYKIDKSRSRRGTGAGLGLAIVKRIVEVHGGERCGSE